MTQHLINVLENALSEFSNRLRIKYGLGTNPSSDLVNRWHLMVKELIRQGNGAEAAGQQAAAALFTDYNTCVYASEAEDIAYLLDELTRDGGK